MPVSFAQRVRIPELMDDPAIDPQAHAVALKGLARLNRLSDSVGVLWPAIRDLARQRPQHPLKILDVATGGGDLPIQLAQRGQRAGIRLHVEGCDISATAQQQATRAAQEAGVYVHFFCQDVLRDPLPTGYDVVLSSLFLHHLAEAEIVQLLQSMRAASTGLILINDLLRNALNYALVWLGTRLVTRSPIVHFDGLASVRSALTVRELQSLAEQAGLDGATVRPRHPCRMLLHWQQPHHAKGL